MRSPTLYLALATSLFSTIATAQTPLAPLTDFDGDGISDVVTTSPSGTDLKWSSTPSATNGTAVDATFGAAEDLAIPGCWLEPDHASLATVHTNTDKGTLTWQVLLDDGQFRDIKFGAPGDMVITGADFDGDGIEDAATMRIVKERFKWTVRRSLLTDNPSKARTFQFGSVGQRVLFLNPDGDRDWVGVFGLAPTKRRSALTLRDATGSKTRRYSRFPRSLSLDPRPRPFAIQSADGTDLLLFVIANGNTKAVVYDLFGTKRGAVSLPGEATFVIGNYDGEDPGEEVLFTVAGTTRMFNPSSGKITQSSSNSGGIDGIEFENTDVPAPQPTVAVGTPTPTPTPTPE